MSLVSGCKSTSSKTQDLKRDYGRHGAIKKVEPVIFPADDSSWIKIDESSRRKVFFNDRLTVELVEWDKSGLTGNITTGRTFHDIVGYVIAGSAMVTVGKDTRQIFAGGAFVVPSNIPYGVIPAAEKTRILYSYTPVREDLRPTAPPKRRFPDNEIKSIAFKWFALFDEKASGGHFLTYLAENNLVMQMPDKKTIRSWQDWETWYSQWLISTDIFSSTVDSIVTRYDETSGHYLVDATVLSTRKTRPEKKLPAKTVSGKCQVHMELIDTDWGDSPKIILYKEEQAK